MKQKHVRILSVLITVIMLMGVLSLTALAGEDAGTPAVTSGSITIDGNSDTYSTIADALAAAKPGATIELGEGEYEAPEGVHGKTPVNLIGVGEGKTTINGAFWMSGTSGNAVTSVEELTIEGISFKNEDSNVVLGFTEIDGCSITVKNCSFSAAGFEGAAHGVHMNNASGTTLNFENVSFSDVAVAMSAHVFTEAGKTSGFGTMGGITLNNCTFAVQEFGADDSNNSFDTYYYTVADYTDNTNAVNGPIVFVNATGSDSENGAMLQAAVDSAADNAVIYVTAGDYDVTYGEDMGGQYHHNLMIDRDNLTIIGEDGATIYAHYISQNGNAQQTVLIAENANNVTIQNLTIKAVKDYYNKTIEIRGAENITIDNCVIDGEGGGAVYIGGNTTGAYTVTNNIIKGSFSIANGAGNAMSGDETATISNNHIEGYVLVTGTRKTGWDQYSIEKLPVLTGNEITGKQYTENGLTHNLIMLYSDMDTTKLPNSDAIQEFINGNDPDSGWTRIAFTVGDPDGAVNSTPYYTNCVGVVQDPIKITQTDGTILSCADLSQAVNVAKNGATIELAEGTYEISEYITLNKKLTIRGAGEDTVLVGKVNGNYGPGLFTLTSGSEGSVLEDLTIEYTETGVQQAAVYFDGGFTGGTNDNVTTIQNVHFIGGESLDKIGGAIAISSTYTTGGHVRISGCTIENFKYGMYFNGIHDLMISNNIIDGTSYNAINIAGDDERYPCDYVTIINNKLTNISAVGYPEDEYSSGIRIGEYAEGTILDNNDITMLNGKQPVYIDEENANYTVTLVNGKEVYRYYIVKEGTSVDLPKLTKKGYTFLGWKSGADRKVYKAGADVKIYEDTTFTAQWMSNWEIVDDIAGAAGSGQEFFTDVKAGDWYYDAVKFVFDNNFMDGVGDGKFNPDGTLTRAMIAQVLYNLEGETGSYPTVFDDVAKSAWYADAVNWAAASGIVEGKGNNKFDPNAAITRQEMAAILYRYSELKGYDVSDVDSLAAFTDANKVADWAKEAMGWAVENYVINGKGAGKLDPTGTATRAEVAQILMNLCNNVL